MLSSTATLEGNRKPSYTEIAPKPPQKDMMSWRAGRHRVDVTWRPTPPPLGGPTFQFCSNGDVEFDMTTH